MKTDRCLGMIVVLGWALFFAVAGCEPSQDLPLAPSPPVVPEEQLRTAPLRVAIGDQVYELESDLWRDFMPVSPPDGQPLVALVRVVERNGKAIAADLKIEHLWVINGVRIWGTALSEEVLPPAPQNELHGIARNGPKWGPHIRVDVVVGLRRGQGSLEILRAADQWIARTD